MANPTASAVHIDVPLTNLAIGIFQEPSNFMGQVFPLVPVEKQSDKYWVWNREDFLRDNFQARPSATESAGTEWSVSSTSYYADTFALHIDLPDQVAANADFDQESRIVRVLTENLRQHIEQQTISQLIASGKWGTDQAGVASGAGANQFLQFDATGADIGASIDALADVILADTGKRPNTLVLGATAWTKAKRSAAVKDQIKYTSAMTPTESVVASMVGVDRIIVARSIKATNAKGQALTTGFNFGAKNGWLGYVEPNPTMEAASAAYIFTWTGLDGASFGVAAPNIYRFDIPEKRVVRFEIQIAYDMVITSTALGKFLSGAVS